MNTSITQFKGQVYLGHMLVWENTDNVEALVEAVEFLRPGRYGLRDLYGVWLKYDNILPVSQAMEENQVAAEAQTYDTTLYVEAGSGVKSRNVYGVGSKGVDYVINSGNKRTAISKRDGGWRKKI
ncbi:hypothetical protein Tco_0586672 [Tanacetum coccineum]